MVGGKAPLDYGCILSRDESPHFYRAYKEYKRSVRSSNRGQPVQRYPLTMNERFPRYVQTLLAGMFYHGMQLSDDRVIKALGHHGECWEWAEINPS